MKRPIQPKSVSSLLAQLVTFALPLGVLGAAGCGANTEGADSAPSSVEQDDNGDTTAGENNQDTEETTATAAENSDDPSDPTATEIASEPEPSSSEAPEPEPAASTPETSSEPEPSASGSEPEPVPSSESCAERPLERCAEDGVCAVSNGFPYDAAGACFSAEPVALACVDATLSCPPTVNAGLDATGMCYSFGNCLPQGIERAADDHPCVAALATPCPDETPLAPEECRSACELAAGECPDQKFLDFEPTREEFADPAQCGSATLFAVEGACADGTPFLYRGTGFTTEVRYFTSGGGFLALSTTTDVVSEPCFGQGYWPEAKACPDAIVTDVLCGTNFAPGDAVSLPFTSGQAR